MFIDKGVKSHDEHEKGEGGCFSGRWRSLRAAIIESDGGALLFPRSDGRDGCGCGGNERNVGDNIHILHRCFFKFLWIVLGRLQDTGEKEEESMKLKFNTETSLPVVRGFVAKNFLRKGKIIGGYRVDPLAIGKPRGCLFLRHFGSISEKQNIPATKMKSWDLMMGDYHIWDVIEALGGENKALTLTPFVFPRMVQTIELKGAGPGLFNGSANIYLTRSRVKDEGVVALVWYIHHDFMTDDDDPELVSFKDETLGYITTKNLTTYLVKRYRKYRERGRDAKNDKCRIFTG